ncbi:MAG: DUF2782 domain-containing protein [Rhodocyclaceae bacterium]|jgi:hypothetical protein|nr:DUF2782 domain-containing protein [Rhodocyclaceae bacterium]
MSFPRPHRISFATLLGLTAWSVAAQTKPALEPLPEPPPPPPGLVDDATLEPQVTIRKQGEDKVEEYRINGRLYMIKVTPPHGKPYYLVDRKGTGSFTQEESAVGDKGISVPMWVIHSF